MQEMKRTVADKVIKDEIKIGKLYLGESARAIITAPDIEYASTMDSPNKAPDLENYASLNLVDFYIIPHYTNHPFKITAHKIVEDYASRLGLQPISNHEAILIAGDKVTIRSK